jgi:dihydroneopterin aldolase
MRNTIHITGLQCDAFIGVYAHEEKARQPLLLEVELRFDATAAALSDRIADTIDYHRLSKQLIAETEARPRRLLEKLHHELLQLLSNQPGAEYARLRIYKPEALKDYGAMVSLSGEWSRS